MTLGETREQISKLDQKLNELRNQKQQLFLQLKKVLNEDENRKKQQKDNEMFAMQALQAQQANLPQPQVFLPPRLQHHQMPILPKVKKNNLFFTNPFVIVKISFIPQPVGNQPMKRGRSPSPPSHLAYFKSGNYPQQSKQLYYQSHINLLIYFHNIKQNTMMADVGLIMPEFCGTVNTFQ